MVAHSPISYPRFADYGVAIPINNEVFVDLDPLVTTADKKALKDIDVVRFNFPKFIMEIASFIWYNLYALAKLVWNFSFGKVLIKY